MFNPHGLSCSPETTGWVSKTSLDITIFWMWEKNMLPRVNKRHDKKVYLGAHAKHEADIDYEFR